MPFAPAIRQPRTWSAIRRRSTRATSGASCIPSATSTRPFSAGLLPGLAFSGWSLLSGGWWITDPMPSRAGHERMQQARRLLDGRASFTRRLVRSARRRSTGSYTFDRETNVHFSGTRHREDRAVAPHRARYGHLPNALPCRIRQSLHAVLSGKRLRDGRRWAGRQEAAHQRVELRPLQDLRHHGPVPDHRLGAARGRRRARSTTAL